MRIRLVLHRVMTLSLHVLHFCRACRQVGSRCGDVKQQVGTQDATDTHNEIRNTEALIRSQVLGLSPGANSEAVQRSYRRAKNDAKGDKSRIEKIEAAHTSIMMSGLSQRMKVRAGSCMLREALLPTAAALLCRGNTQCSARHATSCPAVVAQGGGDVSKEVKYADRAVYFPWRPRSAPWYWKLPS